MSQLWPLILQKTNKQCKHQTTKNKKKSKNVINPIPVTYFHVTMFSNNFTFSSGLMSTQQLSAKQTLINKLTLLIYLFIFIPWPLCLCSSHFLPILKWVYDPSAISFANRTKAWKTAIKTSKGGRNKSSEKFLCGVKISELLTHDWWL